MATIKSSEQPTDIPVKKKIEGEKLKKIEKENFHKIIKYEKNKYITGFLS